MKNYKLHTSEGVRDYLGYELLVKEEIESRIKNLFLSYGYELVKTPTFEYIDLYTSSGAQQPSLYNLINRQGEVLALRNDMTASICRIVATKDNNTVFPKKYCYIANTFRYPRLYQGKSHEFTQAGVEIIGTKNVKAEIECIKLSYKALMNININDFMIHIGSSAFIDKLFDELNFDDEKKNYLLSIIESKDFVTLKNTLKEYKLDSKRIDLIVRLMGQAGKLNFLQEVIDELKGFKSVLILNELKELYNELIRVGLDKRVVFDFSIYSYAKYYTGVTFQIFAPGIGRACVTGGRCDDLLKSFNKDMPAIGFGLDVDACLEFIMKNRLIEIKETRYLSFANKDCYDIAISKNDELRNNGIIVDVSLFDSIEDSLEYAKDMKYEKVLYYHDNNLEEILLGGE